MAADKTHDLFDFMRKLSEEMAAEYDRIQKRATEDPGTAGDQGEENWAELLRGWLPHDYAVVTKGRIISHEGVTSPQVDVLVLNGAYPKKLLNKKLYLAAGVAAAFECKTTLKAAHIDRAVQNSTKIKSLYATRSGTPYKELHAPVVYGLLAHSHTWKGKRSTPQQNIEDRLFAVDAKLVTHPRLQLDLLCVADLAAWRSTALAFISPHDAPNVPAMTDIYGPQGSACGAHLSHTPYGHQEMDQSTPIGILISYLTQRLAWEEPSLRGLADYYRAVDMAGPGGGPMRMWPTSIYSDPVRARLETDHQLSGAPWDEWGRVQAVDATMLASLSAGVWYSRVLRGRVFSRAAATSRSTWS